MKIENYDVVFKVMRVFTATVLTFGVFVWWNYDVLIITESMFMMMLFLTWMFVVNYIDNMIFGE